MRPDTMGQARRPERNATLTSASRRVYPATLDWVQINGKGEPSMRSRLILIAAVAAATLLPMAPAAAGTQPVRLLETGSTLLYPLFNIWVPFYTHHVARAVQITTQGTGSGTGIAEATQGTAQIGASDAYMSDAQVKSDPGVLNIPLAISVQVIAYNLPSVRGHLRLDGQVLAEIYAHRITRWNDRRIARLNPGVKLPPLAIVPVRRNDSSGDTFLFTQYLSGMDRSWSKTVGYGTQVSWPANPALVGATGNPGVVEALRSRTGTVGYVGISWQRELDAAHLGVAAIENRAHRFLLATPQTVKAAAAARVAKTPRDERISLILAPGPQAYPIINYEYAVVMSRQKDLRTAAAIRGFLDWCVSPRGGNRAAFLDRVHFLALPPAVVKDSQAQIAKIR